MPSIFISHATEDRPFLETELLAQLTDAGYTPWYCKDHIGPREIWRDSIQTALQQCDWFVVVLSPHAVASQWVGWEVHWALQNRVGRVVPVLVRDCLVGELHIGLTTIQAVNYRVVSDDARQNLRAAFDLARQVESLYLSLELTRWRNEHEGWVPTHVGGLPLQPGDRIRVAVRANRPAPIFVAIIDGHGRAMPCYPWTSGGWVAASCEPSARLELPSNDPDEGWVVQNAGEAITLAVLCGESLSRVALDWEALFEDLPSTSILPDPTRPSSFVWRKSASAVQPTRGTFLFATAKVQNRLLPVYQELRDRLGIYADLLLAHTFPCLS